MSNPTHLDLPPLPVPSLGTFIDISDAPLLPLARPANFFTEIDQVIYYMTDHIRLCPEDMRHTFQLAHLDDIHYCGDIVRKIDLHVAATAHHLILNFSIDDPLHSPFLMTLAEAEYLHDHPDFFTIWFHNALSDQSNPESSLIWRALATFHATQSSDPNSSAPIEDSTSAL